jgi:hypothetical protein
VKQDVIHSFDVTTAEPFQASMRQTISFIDTKDDVRVVEMRQHPLQQVACKFHALSVFRPRIHTNHPNQHNHQHKHFNNNQV